MLFNSQERGAWHGKPTWTVQQDFMGYSCGLGSQSSLPPAFPQRRGCAKSLAGGQQGPPKIPKSSSHSLKVVVERAKPGHGHLPAPCATQCVGRGGLDQM